MNVVIDLPRPVSVNALWRKGPYGMHKSSAYKAWQEEAGLLLNTQRPGCVTGPYDITILVRRPSGKRKPDLGNMEKGVSDLLQAHHVIENDSLAESITIAWTDDHSIAGCRVQVHSAVAAEVPFG